VTSSRNYTTGITTITRFPYSGVWKGNSFHVPETGALVGNSGVDICHLKKYFKVEGTMKLHKAKVRFREARVQNVTGTILVAVKISLCKGDYPVKLHEFDKKIEVA